MAQYVEAYGKTLEFPDGMSQEDMAAAIKKSSLSLSKPAPEKPKETGMLANMAAGAVRGAGSIGATLLSPIDAAARALNGGKPVSVGGYDIVGQDRRAGMDAGLSELGANTDSLAFKGGKLAGEIAGTAGMGGAIANGARLLPMAGRMAPGIDAIKTAGMSAGGMTGMGGLATRAAGGAVTGGASAALVSPDDVGAGAGIGAVMPGALQLAGKAGSAVGRTFRGQAAKTADELAAALGVSKAELPAVLDKLRKAETLVPGASPTVAQALQTPQAAILERVISDSRGGASLKGVYDAQNAARLSALDGVAAVDPRGFRSAQQDFGASALDLIRSGDKKARAATSAAYKDIPQDEAALYLPDLAAVRNEYFPRGAFGDRAAADQAVSVAESIGNVAAPAIKAARAPAQGETLAQAVRRAGGLSINDRGGLRGEVDALRGDLKNLVRVNGGLSTSRMAEKMQQQGFLKTNDQRELIEALKSDSRGGYARSMYDDPVKEWAAAREAAMGAPPGAELVPQKVTLGEFDALRKSIGNAERAAARDPARATEALALGKMKSSLDDRINQVVGGDGAADEVLPIAWADALTNAQALKRSQVEKFRTGPQADAFRRGADNMPAVQGGEFAAKAWGNRAGIADDIKQLRKVLDDNPRVLGQFRSMITTEGAGTATNAGNLSGKFARWVDNALPGLKESFSAAEVKTMERIAQDIRRAESAAAAGMSRGSNTYQNASNALGLGLLDSPLLNATAGRIPLVGSFAGGLLDTIKGGAREAKAQRLASLLGDSGATAKALSAQQKRRLLDLLPMDQITRAGLLSAPILATDQ